MELAAGRIIAWMMGVLAYPPLCTCACDVRGVSLVALTYMGGRPVSGLGFPELSHTPALHHVGWIPYVFNKGIFYFFLHFLRPDVLVGTLYYGLLLPAGTTPSPPCHSPLTFMLSSLPPFSSFS